MNILENLNSQGLFLVSSTVILLIIIFFLYKTYRSSINVEARLAEFSSLTDNRFGRKLRLIEVNADEFKLNKQVLGPLARIIDEYCVMTTDDHGTITFANHKFLSLSGFNFNELIGRPESINFPEQDDLADARMESQHARQGVWNGEVCNRRQDGSLYWMNIFIFPLSYISDEDQGYICFGTDITHIKAQNNELKQAVRDQEQKISEVETLLLHSEKMASLGTISAGIAHEINNPIASLASNLNRCQEYLQALASITEGLRKRISDEKFRQFLETGNLPVNREDKLDFILADYPELMAETHDGIDRIKKIIRDLKHFSRNKDEDFSPVDLARCVDISLNLAHHELKHRIAITRYFAPDLPTINGSESQLAQVLMNLLVNAAQAIEGEGEIVISATADDKWYQLTVKDDGPGIPAETLAQIFEPFFTTKPIGQGTGLGLSISQDIIKRHGGTMSADSSAGKGTTFYIRLPLDRNGQSSHAA
ncbi:PAS domain-containing sensor histidine kinase [Alcanivorax hongdengensis]|nr:ATP-binding protein [Alcanivorax hongdengensis]